MFNYQGKFAIFHNSIIFFIFILAIVLAIEILIHPLKPKEEFTIDPFLYQKLLISHFEHLKKDTINIKKKKGHI